MLVASSYATAPKIYLNPGHGGYNSNDRNIVTINHAAGDQSGFWESQANLTKALYLRDMLQEAGATVYMSRTDNRSGYRDDTSISNTIGDRPLSTIAREASGKADFFLSIHSNASGNSTTSATNYLLLMLTGKAGTSDWGTSYKYSEAKQAADLAWPRMQANEMTWWGGTTQRIYSYTTYTVISPSYLTIPGYLSEGEFHDYKPEAHRLLNADYCKLEAYRFLQAFCDYYPQLVRPTTGVVCGDVRDNTETMSSFTLYQLAKDKDVYKPLNGAKVKLKDGSGNVIATYTCDSEYNGFYAFWDVAPGTYTVQCAAEGHASVSRTVTVSANTITYNRVNLGAGSGDGMEDVTVSPIGVLYDTLISSSSARWLDEKTIRRTVQKDDTLYILTADSRILAVDANSGEQIAELSTSGISTTANTERKIGDIALTDDNILVGCTQEHTVSVGTYYWKVYKWANNEADPELLFQSNSSANMFDASIGRKMAVTGTISDMRVFALAYSLQSSGIRLMQYTWNGSPVSAIRNNNTSGNTLGDSTIWADVELTASPYSNTQFLINGKNLSPTMLTLVQNDGQVFSKNEYTSLPQETSGGSFVNYQGHILYITPYGSDNISVAIYEASAGLGAATLLKTLYPSTTLPIGEVGYMSASALPDGEELVVTLYRQNDGITRWRLSTTDLEAQDQTIEPTVELIDGNAPKREWRAGWISTAWALDWPLTMGTSATVVATQKQNLTTLLDRMQQARMNAVLFQVRGMSDAMYDSEYEPWSKFITGTRGMAPEYDPLALAIEQAHQRGMELHAWLNPLRYSSSTATYSNSINGDIAGEHNDWLLYYGDATPDTVILNPGLPEVRTYIANLVVDIISKYDVDGIVFDDYFYVNGKTTNAMDQAAYEAYNADGLSRADWRRQNVNKLIREVNDAIKAVKPWVRFGVAPPGVAATEQAVADKYGIDKSPAPSGYDWQYNGQYSEPVQWLIDQTIDYISPQIYWKIGHKTNDYVSLTEWWAAVANKFSRPAFPSQSYSAINASGNDSEVADQIAANRNAATANNTVTGAALFRMGQTSDAFVGKLTAAYTEHALPPAMTWYEPTELTAPTNLVLSESTLTWQHPSAERFSLYAYPKGGNQAKALASSAYLLGICYGKSFDLSSVVNLEDMTVAVCPLDRYGNEHQDALYNESTQAEVLTGMAGANIYASELSMSLSDDTYTFSYRLNENATDVTLQLIYEGKVIQTKSFGAQEKGLRSGSLALSEINWPERHSDDHLTWAILATARPINAITKLSDDSEAFQFYRPFGVAVDSNPESDFFGRVYVTNTKSGTCASGRTTANGLYAFNAALDMLNATAFDSGVSWNNATTNGNSPFRLAVADDGRVFLCDWSDAHSGIWIAPAGGITGYFEELFAGLNRSSSGLATNSNGTAVHGSISGCWVDGSGDNTRLYTMDEDYLVDGKAGNMLRYDIGSGNTWTEAPSAIAFANAANGNPLVNTTLQPVSDRHGGFWIVQYRYAETSLEPSLIHVVNGAIDYNTGGEQLLDNSRNGGLAVSSDGARIATTSDSQINVWDVEYDAEGRLTSITPAFEITKNDIPTGLGANSNDVAFDPAGNIYYVSNTSERLVVIGLPKADNSFITPARSSLTIPLPAEVPAIEVNVTQWQTDGLFVDFAQTPDATSVQVKLGDLITDALPLETLYAATPTGNVVADNSKHITLPDINLADYANMPLTLRFENEGVATGEATLTVPMLVAGTATLTQLNANNPDWQQTSVIVTEGATLIADLAQLGGSLQVGSVEIYPNGFLSLTGGTLSLGELVLRAGWNATRTAFRTPMMVIDDGAALTTAEASIDWVVDDAQNYPVAVPYSASVTDLSYRFHPAADATAGVTLREYDGQTRVASEQHLVWKTLATPQLIPGVGYALTAERPANVAFAIVRMPLIMAETTESTNLTAWGVGDDYDWAACGWNYVANPYLTNLDYATTRYVNIPNNDFTDYLQLNIDEARLEPLQPFFVQTGTDATLLFTKQNPTLIPATYAMAPARSAANPAVELRLSITGGNGHDRTYILFDDEFAPEPDYDADLPKLSGTGTPKLFSIFDGQNLASLALPTEQLDLTIPLGVKLGTDATYTFSLMTEASRLKGIQRLELIDLYAGITTDLMTDDYTVYLNAGQETEQFYLHAVRSQNIGTDLENTIGTENNKENTNGNDNADSTENTNSHNPHAARKYIRDNQVIIELNGKLYDSTGRLIDN